MITNFFHPSLLLLFLDQGSDVRDPVWIKLGSGIQDKHPGSATLNAKKYLFTRSEKLY